MNGCSGCRWGLGLALVLATPAAWAGDYGFGAPVAIAPSAVAPRALAAGDVDGDGLDDIVVLAGGFIEPYQRRVLVYRQRAAGGFAAPLSLPYADAPGSGYDCALLLVDIDADGKLDILVSDSGFPDGTLSVLRNDGGSFVRSATLQTDGQWQLNATDVNGDGHLDIIATGGLDSTFDVFHGDGEGGLVDATPWPNIWSSSRKYLVDVDGDGAKDVVYAEDRTMWMRRHAGTGFAATPVALFSVPARFPGGVRPAFADFDRDGTTDAAVAWDDGPRSQLAVYHQGADGRFSRPRAFGPASSVVDLQAVDLDDDGLLDIAMHSTSTGLGARMAESRGFGPRMDFALTSYMLPPVFGDFDADGRLDVAFSDGGIAFAPGVAEAVVGDIALDAALAPGVLTLTVRNTDLDRPSAQTRVSARVSARTGGVVPGGSSGNCGSQASGNSLITECNVPSLPAGGAVQLTVPYALAPPVVLPNHVSARAEALVFGFDLREDNNVAGARLRLAPPPAPVPPAKRGR